MPDPFLKLDHEPNAFELLNPHGRSPWLFTCDHASARLPLCLGTLGLSPAELATHIASDIGAAAVGRRLAEALDAVLIVQNYSRLVVDCNRPPGSADSIVSLSERTRIPGNENLSPESIAERRAAIFEPYHRCIATEIDRREAKGQATLLLALHSFTPVYHDQPRPWHLGLLYHRDPRLGRRLLERLRDPASPTGAWQVGDNQPYSMDDDTDHTLPEHGERRGLPHAGLEIRQDLISDGDGQTLCAERLSRVLAETQRLFSPG